MTSITKEIRKLQAMSLPDLALKYQDVFGKPPRVKQKGYLQRRIAWQLQADRFGGLSRTAQRRLDEIMSTIELPVDSNKSCTTRASVRPRKGTDPMIGSTLIRTYHGRDYRVQVTEEGFEYDGILYRSLSAVAKQITGSHWNGLLFFNISKRKKSK